MEPICKSSNLDCLHKRVGMIEGGRSLKFKIWFRVKD